MSRSNLMNVYGRFDVTFVSGLGSKIYDKDNKEYLDFVSGVAVNCLGHCSPVIVGAIEKQSKKLMHISNYYWNEPAIELAELLCKYSDHDKVFFCNSGAEAIEAALKLARKYGVATGNKNKNEIIYMNNSFHGRTLGALSVTGQPKYQESFKPLIGGVQSVDFNDAKALEEKINDNTCAVILEPIQGEGGIISADKIYLKKVRELCDKHNALLIFDEVQCGIGRTGEFFAYKKFGVVPDIISVAKALGGGFPIGATIALEKVAAAFVPGDHGNTYGGNPLACAVGVAIIKELTDKGVIEGIGAKHKYINEKLISLKERYSNVINDIRGTGLLIGISIKVDPKLFINKCFEKGLLVITAGKDVVRLLPPLNVNYEDIDKALLIIEETIKEF